MRIHHKTKSNADANRCLCFLNRDGEQALEVNAPKVIKVTRDDVAHNSDYIPPLAKAQGA